MKVYTIPSLHSISSTNLEEGFTPFLPFSDIPEDLPVLNPNKMINIDAKKLQTETTGEKIVRQLQDYLLQHTSADE